MATDYISREAAEERLNRLERESHHNSVLWPDHVEECREAIRDIPAADVRPVVRGSWRFEKGDGKTCVDGWVCTACNYGFHTNVPYFGGFNFCPQCGADMRPKKGG